MERLDAVRAARAVLAGLDVAGSPPLHELIAARGPVAALAALTFADPAVEGVPLGVLRNRLRAQTTAIGAQTLRAGARVVIPEDDEWPTTLADLAATPLGQAPGAALCLWVRGDALLAATLRCAVAVVGARAATAYGEHVASELGYGLSERGWTVVSTGAYGVEAAALRGAVAGAGPAVAVLPAGVDRPYPAGNADLFDRIAMAGLLVSPWPPGTAPTRTRFAATARLVAAMTGGTVLVEATRRSGALGAAGRSARCSRRSTWAARRWWSPVRSPPSCPPAPTTRCANTGRPAS
jgi:DNA processing protein